MLIDNETDEQCLQLINTEEQSEQHTVMSNNNEAQPNINTERTSDTHIPESESWRVNESTDRWGCAILALEVVPKNLIFT